MDKKIYFTFLILSIVGIGLVSAQFYGGSNYGFNQNYQYYQPSFDRIYSGADIQNYWPILKTFDSGQCEATTDFIVGIPPGGCSPAVVRSDLLAEQNVPVFCQLYAIKVNPLVKVSSIQSISFKGDYPEGVSGISFHPARASSRSYTTLLGDPVINNIGYVVIILKRNQVESNLEDWIAGNLTATMRYDLEEAYGAGESEYYLHFEEEGDENAYARASFWRGSGSLRLKGIDSDSATVEVLSNKDHILSTITLREGQTGDVIYLPYYYCKAGLRLKLNQVVSPEDSALLNLDGQELWVRSGTRILNGKCVVKSLDVSGQNNGFVKISCPGNSFSLYLGSKEDGGELAEKSYSSDVEDNFREGVDTVRVLVDDYGIEKKDSGEITYAEEALYDQIELARDLGKQKTEAELLGIFIEEFPLSRLIDQVRFDRQLLDDIDFSNATRSIYVTNDYHTVGLRSLKEYSNGSAKAQIRIGGGSSVLVHEGEEVGEYTIGRIRPGEVTIYYKNGSARDRRSISIGQGEEKSLGGKDIYVADVEVAAVAHLSVIPEIKQTKTEADFTFRIGVEKRAIQLSPEKTEELISNINDSLEKWTEINDKLGDTIKAWKGACFATSTFLMLKNVASGFSGEGLARQKVMEKYKVICDTQYSDMSHDACYNELSKNISEDVSSMTEALKSVNGVLDDKIKNHEVSGGFLGDGTIVNSTAYVDDLKGELGDWSTVVDGQIISASDLNTVEQVRSVLLARELGMVGGVANDSAQAEMQTALRNVAFTKKENDYKEKNKAKFSFGDVVFPISVLTDGQDRFEDGGLRLTGSKLQGIVNGDLGLDQGKTYGVQVVHVNSNDYLYVFDPDNGAQEGVWEVSGGEGSLKVLEERNSLPSGRGAQVFLSKGGCVNSWSGGDAKVSFYESGKDKGLPAIVPFDLKEGWYAKIPSSGASPFESSPQGYQESGAVEYFSICNIGPNGIMENGVGDDLCQTFSIYSAGSVDQFLPCSDLSSAKVKNLYDRALEAIRQASRQYGQRTFTIFDQEMKLGSPSSVTSELECQDFMSPDDCNLMFNVCDPVICPSSRCDLGGKMPVADVIQTGIVGGILMCLPNAKEGIKVPICLSGIHAGIESYVSILESEQACLQESLDSGRLVGICDEITSIYKCEFFWKQAVPVIEFAAPRIVENFVSGGKRTHGGGEYLFVQKAFDNLDASIDYFKSTYAPNAFRAFNLRNIEEAGSEVCRAFLGSSLPTSADAIDSLLEPESPPQFNAYFSESLFSEATLPATSHYKVYYHIFAGNDRGVYYRVYLRDPPQTSYYATAPRLYVKSGYVSRGESADETIDFTAPQGYKELCVSIDNQEECGFSSVSSGIAVDLVSDAYSLDQASKQNITSEKECVSGSPSVVSLANPNLQAGVEEVINPQIALNGIVRVCASSSPGDLSRWRDVGYCGEVNLRCYLDTESVREDIEQLQGLGSALSVEDLQGASEEFLAGSAENYNRTMARLSSAREDIRKGDTSNEVIASLDVVIGAESGALNNYKAEALALKASIYRARVRKADMTSIPNEGDGPRDQDVLDSRETNSSGDIYSESNSTNNTDSLRITFGELEAGDLLFNYRNGVLYRVALVTPKSNGDLIFSLRQGITNQGTQTSKTYSPSEYLDKEENGFELVVDNGYVDSDKCKEAFDNLNLYNNSQVVEFCAPEKLSYVL